MLARVRKFFGLKARAPGGTLRRIVRVIRGRYDAAATTEENRRHWANADGLSANAANSPQIRRILRNRARYESANNSYAKGIVLTLANDCIGTGPRLQMLTADAEANRQIESAFMAWAKAIALSERLRTLRMARACDGEGFLVLTNNPALPTPVKLDLRPVEAEQVSTPNLGAGGLGKLSAIDGIEFDAYGNPAHYHILKAHPGEGANSLEALFDRVPAAAVIHYFRSDRPGQARGVPEITPALPLFAQLRRYTLAVLGSAEAVANVTLGLETDSPPNGDAADLEPLDTIEMERGMVTTLPGGWKLSQIKAEQPTTTYSEFKHEILNEIARCLNMPFNVAAGNSSGYNYASGRLDHQTYFKSIRVDQAQLGDAVLDRIFNAWLREAVLIEGLLPQSVRKVGADLSRQWFWDGHEHVDPLKEANAQATRLSNHTTTLAEEYAKRGRDWEAELRQRAKEATLMAELGLAQPQAPVAVPEPIDEEALADAA